MLLVAACLNLPVSFSALEFHLYSAKKESTGFTSQPATDCFSSRIYLRLKLEFDGLALFKVWTIMFSRVRLVSSFAVFHPLLSWILVVVWSSTYTAHSVKPFFICKQYSQEQLHEKTLSLTCLLCIANQIYRLHLQIWKSVSIALGNLLFISSISSVMFFETFRHSVVLKRSQLKQEDLNVNANVHKELYFMPRFEVVSAHQDGTTASWKATRCAFDTVTAEILPVNGTFWSDGNVNHLQKWSTQWNVTATLFIAFLQYN